MAAEADFEAAYGQLRAIMTGAAPDMKVVTDHVGHLVLHAPWTHDAKPKDPVWFGAVQVKKAYVSYHLMAFYGRPELSQGVSAELARRMQGKSCFNFKRPEPQLFDELYALTRRGAELYAKPFELRPHG